MAARPSWHTSESAVKPFIEALPSVSALLTSSFARQ
jgi:hypothetical protein